MSSTSAPTVTITPASTTAQVGDAAPSAQGTLPLYSVYAKYDYDPRSFNVGNYLSYDDAKQGLEGQVINGAQLAIYQVDVIDRTAG